MSPNSRTTRAVRQGAAAARIAMLAAALGTGYVGEARALFCRTGSVEVTAITEAEYHQLAAQAGAAACVTPRASGLTLCQITPPVAADHWTVVAQAPAGGSDAQSAVELKVQSGFKCLFDASTPAESTDSRWIKAQSAFSIPQDPPAILDFIAVVQIGPGTQTTATVCPFGDGDDGRTCAQQP